MRLTPLLKTKITEAQEQGVPFLIDERVTLDHSQAVPCGLAALKQTNFEGTAFLVEKVLVRLFEIVNDEIRPINYEDFHDGQELDDSRYTVTIPKVFEEIETPVTDFLKREITALDRQTLKKYFREGSTRLAISPSEILGLATHFHTTTQPLEQEVDCIACDLVPMAQMITGYLFDRSSDRDAVVNTRVRNIFLACAYNQVTNPDLVASLEEKVGTISFDHCDVPCTRMMSPVLPNVMRRRFISLAQTVPRVV